MNTSSEEPPLHAQVTGQAELEQAHDRLHEALTNGGVVRAPASGEEEQAGRQTRARSQRSSRRKVLAKGLGIATVASAGAGALLELSGGTAKAAKPPGPGVFASNTAGTPAVSTTGTNGADGVDASSDSGTGLLASSSSGLAGHFIGNVKMENNLTVSTLKSGAGGTFASGTAGTPALSATGLNGADGVDTSSDSGTALVATSSTGLAGHFVGNVKMENNLTVANKLTGESGLFVTQGGPAVRGVSPGLAVIVAECTGGNNSSVGLLASNTIGTGVQGGSDSGIGVNGTSNSFIGVRGDSTSLYGVLGNSSLGTGVLGRSAGGPSSIAVHGQNSSGGTGVQGDSDTGIGVQGSSSSSSGGGVFGSGGLIGVQGVSSGTGVRGDSDTGIGVHGTSSGGGLAGRFDGNVQVNGNFSATGTKNFVQAHPSDPSREIVYVALEGGEAGTYVRGTGQLQGGKAVLALPEHFGLVTATEGLTAQLTPRGEWLQLYVAELDTTQLVVREAQGKSGAFDYFICGVRRGYEQHEVLRAKR